MKHHHMKHHDGHHMHHHDGHHSSHGIYKNEVEKPEQPPMSHISPMENMGYGMRDFKGEADPIAMGQAGGPGCKQDESRIHSQFKDYHWD